jgi:hypothetical protein
MNSFIFPSDYKSNNLSLNESIKSSQYQIDSIKITDDTSDINNINTRISITNQSIAELQGLIGPPRI